MKHLLLSALIAGTTLLWANNGGCTLVQSGDLSINWKAFKTSKKIGVGGTLPSLVYTPAAKKGKNFRELFVGSTVTIDTHKVDSGHAPRDAKLVKFFFSQMKSMQIQGKITDIKAAPRKKGEPFTGTLNVMLTMNGKSVPATMDYTYADKKFEAHGKIDLADFAALDALSSINKACYELHKGKTWSDVEIGFSTTVEATECQTKETK